MGGFEFGEQVGAAGFERLEIDCFVVRFALAPADKEDALPLESQGADGGGMGFAAGFLIRKKGARPGAVQRGLAGVFKEALMHELRARPAAMDPGALAAAFGDGRDAAVLLDGSRRLEAAAIAAEGGQKARPGITVAPEPYVPKEVASTGGGAH